MKSKITILQVVLLILIPLISLADGDDKSLEIDKLKAKDQPINQLTANIQEKLAQLNKVATDIKTLIAQYEAILKEARQPVKKHEIPFETVSQNNLIKLTQVAELAEQACQSAEKQAEAVRATFDKLSTSVEQMAKLTDTVNISNDGQVININGAYTLIITDRTCANQAWYAEIQTPKQGNLLLDIRANFSHCTSGCHWAFRHLQVLFNAYTSQVILNDTNNNGNGAGQWTIKRIVTSGKHAEKMRLEKSAGSQKWCGPVDIKIESNQPIKRLKTDSL